MNLFAVAIRDYSVAYIEFYWADDLDHAEEQAVNAHPTSRIVCAKEVPDRKDMVHVSSLKEEKNV